MVDFVGLTQTKQSAQETVRVRRTPAIDPSHYPAIAQAIAKAAAPHAPASKGGEEREGKAFSDLGKGKLKEVAKLTKWARVTDKLIPEETCPVCLCEFEQEAEEGAEEREEKEGEGKGKEPEPDDKQETSSKDKKKNKKSKSNSKKKSKEKAIEDEADDGTDRLPVSHLRDHFTDSLTILVDQQ
jgi:hypothetical protein